MCLINQQCSWFVITTRQALNSQRGLLRFFTPKMMFWCMRTGSLLRCLLFVAWHDCCITKLVRSLPKMWNCLRDDYWKSMFVCNENWLYKQYYIKVFLLFIYEKKCFLTMMTSFAPDWKKEKNTSFTYNNIRFSFKLFTSNIEPSKTSKLFETPLPNTFAGSGDPEWPSDPQLFLAFASSWTIYPRSFSR